MKHFGRTLAWIPLLCGAAVHAQLETIFTLDFDNGQWQSGWYYAGDAPQFVPSPTATGLGLYMKPWELQSGPVNVPPYEPMAFFPIPGGYSPEYAYQIEASCFGELLIPGMLQTGSAALGWFNGTSFTGGLQMIGFAADPFTYGVSTWSSGNAAPATGTFGVIMRADIHDEDPDLGATFDNVMVHRRPYAASAKEIRFNLDGPYNAALGRMRSDLRDQGLIPLTEPYTALGYTQVDGGGETVTANWVNQNYGGHYAVDWVRLELRSAADPAQLVSTLQCILWSSGRLYREGFAELFFSAPPGSYYVVVRHRNHLATMTAAPVYLNPNTGTPTPVDFRLPTTATYGTDARKAIGSVMTLWSGDVNHDGELRYVGTNNDRDFILVAIGGSTPTATLTGQYRQEDTNLNGVVSYVGADNDRDPILSNIGGGTPTAVRVEQVP